MAFKKQGLLVIGLVMILLAATLGNGLVLATAAGDADLYFPLTPGSYWIYKNTMTGQPGIITEKYKVLQMRDDNDRVVAYRNSAPVALVYYQRNSKGLFKTKTTDLRNTFTFQPPLQVLPFKISTGLTWSWKSDDQKMQESAQIGPIEKVTIPAGSFSALMVQYNGIGPNGKPYTDKTWFVKGIGFIKDVYTLEGKSSTLELIKYQIAK